ncbi:MAG: Gfo/Idh/MocA family oxidoreductase [Clostridia bacterium]|nr:Gfo/Idh/MocA family oxidoreductase [Clostridia bacterium]
MKTEEIIDRPLTVAVIGYGPRGQTYTHHMKARPEQFTVVAGCEMRSARLRQMQETFELPDDAVFADEEEFFAEKRADLLIVATQDRDHVRHALKGLELGCHILCEKPLTNDPKECKALLAAQKKADRKVIVCHVLRYAPAYAKFKELLDAGTIGEVVSVDQTENVYYAHQAHSFVRGNWRDSETTSPMILAKCCHDLDLLQWFAGSPCESVSSLGDLTLFVPENKPKEAADRCTECALSDTCPYSAVDIYLRKKFWGRFMVSDERPLTDEAVEKGLREGPYGRCVYACDNNVVDHQTVEMRFANGVTAHLNMIGLSGYAGRQIKAYGTLGEIDFDDHKKTIEIYPFGGEPTVIDTTTLDTVPDGHGGGDDGLVSALYDMLTDRSPALTSLAASVESHYIAYAAEKSRLKGGKPVRIKH